jgi:hypothetical protein
VVISQTEIADYYRDVFVPRLRTRSPGRVVPTLEEAKSTMDIFCSDVKPALESM